MINFLLGVLSSLIASFIFLLAILVFLRPSLKISDIIVQAEEDGQWCYRIKFYNTSLFSAYDCIIDLTVLEERHAEPYGKHVYFQTVQLTKNSFAFIHQWKPKCLTKNYAHHCTQIKTYEDLKAILSHPYKSLQLKIALRHGLTGLSKNFIRNYPTDHVIEKGIFRFGNSFAVLAKRD